jgi:regulator of cell morphogenesis and NO signaling
METFSTKTIREIAVANPAVTRVFEQFKVDYCCGGKKPFNEACATAGIAPEFLEQKLNEILQDDVIETEAPENKKASDLIDHIMEKHHVFTRSEIDRLNTLLSKVIVRHGGTHPELFVLENNFEQLYAELLRHMHTEDAVLFPYIKHLESSAEHDLSSPHPSFGSVRNPIRMMISEHDKAGDILKEMRTLTSDYTLPEGACTSFHALYFGLGELEKDLHQHIHLENNVLFPKAIELEAFVVEN